MKIHEYQARNLFAEYGIPISQGDVAQTPEEAIKIANDSPFGLSGSIWTRNAGRALRVARGVETGALSVNSNSSVRYSTPFGGYKLSGIGRELGPDALRSFSEEKNVFISTEE